MTQHESPEDVMTGYWEEARRLVKRYDWQLVTDTELVERALALIADGDSNRFSKALVGAYCVIMYKAFAGEQGAEQQQRACEELGHALSSLLLKNYPDLPPDERQDVAQNTLERVWRARESCREPVAFLAFAASHLLSSVQLARRQLRRVGEPLKASFDSEEDAIDIPDEAPPLLSQVLGKERRSDCETFLRDLRQARPRAKIQIDVLELRCLEDMEYTEIADRLHISAASAQTKLSLILKTIRNDPELSRRARKLGLMEQV